MTITNAMIETAYCYAVKVHHGNIGRSSAENAIHLESGMNRASAQAYIQIFRCMMKGQGFKRAMSLSSHRYFLESIRKDFGETAFQKALKADEEHVKYYASVHIGRLAGVEELIRQLKCS